ncbi:flippase [Yokenella regensburgei]|uniref:flippase n=1 Tax=Yokenella regensburgei TaxID=158877 RepID=UPI003ED94AAE
MSIKKNTLWNLVGSGAPLLIGAITIPYLLKEMKVELFGVLTLIWVLIGYFSLFDFGLGRALTQILAKLRHSESKEYLSDVSSVGIILIFYLGIVGGIILAALACPLGYDWLKVNQAFQGQVVTSLLIASIGIPLTTLTSGYKGILEAYLQFSYVNYLRVLLGVGNFALPALSVYLYGASLPKIVISLVLVRFVVLLLHVICVSRLLEVKYVKLKSHKTIVNDFAAFGSWMTLSNILSPLMVTADRFVLSAIVGASLLAYYTVPFEVIIRLLIIPAALTGAFFPQISALLNKDKRKAKILFNQCVKIIFIVMLCICGTIAVFSKLGLALWIDKSFADKSWYVASILVIGILFNSVAQIPYATVQASGNVKATSIVHLSEFVVYIPLLIVTVYYFGIIGAACTWVCRAALDMVLMFILSHRVFN